MNECRHVWKAPKDAQGWGKRMCWQYGIDYRKNLKKAMYDLVDGAWGKFVVNSIDKNDFSIHIQHDAIKLPIMVVQLA